MPLTQPQIDDIQTQLFYSNLVTEVDNALTNLNAENITFDGHLFLIVPNEDVPVRLAKSGTDITLDIGIEAGDNPGTAPYSFTIPAIWFTG